MRDRIEWPTLLLMAVTYGVWALATTVLWQAFAPLGFVLTALALVQYSSLQHEVLHGHPFRSAAWNEALVFAALPLFVPYRRFRDTHLAHHRDERLTDPYEDPEANYLDVAIWARLPIWLRIVLRMNNTLLGRMVMGPAISILAFVRGDLTVGDAAVRQAWGLHFLGLVPVLLWLWAMPGASVLGYLGAAYLAFSILKIRTFAEHRAHEKARGRTVIIEDRGPLALLFLNNNLHVVHHAKPGVAWYRLPGLYRARKADYLRRNEGYLFRSYGELFARYFLRAKDPVAHPLWPDNMERPAPTDGPATGSALSAAFPGEAVAEDRSVLQRS